VLAADLIGGTQVVVADLNKDGRPDILAVARSRDELIWFENPGWKRHVIAGGLPDISNIAVWDIDGDGIPEIVVAHESKTLGILSVLKRAGDPLQPWKIVEIDRIPNSHLLRWADLSGSGKKVVVDVPLAGAKLMYKPGVWMRETIPDEGAAPVAGASVADWEGDGREGILASSPAGIHLLQLGKDGAWKKIELSPAPATAAAAGWTGVKPARTRFLAALASQVVAYRPDAKGKWLRQTVDDTPGEGGAILTADLNADGNDEIIAGQGRALNVYYSNNGKGWAKVPLDNGGIAAADCAVADLNGDGRPDVVCIGSETANLKWYENRGGPRK
jgi:hypothetical protein